MFVTGTGTGVGKTVVTACLAALLLESGRSFCVYKPVQTGSNADAPEDLVSICNWLGFDVPVFCSYCFPEPAAPWVADRHGVIEPGVLLAEYQRLALQYETVLVEGAGGIRVPVTDNWEMVDVIKAFNLPVVVVTGSGLGSVNHLLLTVEALEARNIPVCQVVISNWNTERLSSDTQPVEASSVYSLAVQTFPAVVRQYLPGNLNVSILPPLPVQPGFLKMVSVLQQVKSALGSLL
jgi:dethiobiotin synthetase